MFQHQGIWFPDGEAHFPGWMDKHGEVVDGKGTYQIKKWRACLPWIKQWRTAIDVGGHVGLWAMHMAKRFDHVEAFEPVSQFRECFSRNVEATNVVVRACALGNRHGGVVMAIDPADSGGTHVMQASSAAPVVGLCKLDSFDFAANVDFIKIDVEGYEHHVIEGARDTIARCKPCIIVEQKPHKLGPNFGIKGTPAVDMLKGMGAKVRAELSGDYILSWD